MRRPMVKLNYQPMDIQKGVGAILIKPIDLGDSKEFFPTTILIFSQKRGIGYFVIFTPNLTLLV